MRLVRTKLAFTALAATVALAFPHAPLAADTARFSAPLEERAVLSVHAATDLVAMEPLIRGFQEREPHVTVEFVEYVTNELYAAMVAACEAGEPLADIVLSSSVNQTVKLVNDGCAQPHRSTETAGVPRWANWRDEVFGFTFEPAVIVYNRDLVPPDDVPRTHIELAELLRAKADRYAGKVGTYDIRKSGIGFLFAAHDAEQTSTYGRLLESLGRADPVVRCCTSRILNRIESGELLIGYNLLGSYAYGRLRAGAPIGIVLPRDYTTVLSRAAMIPATAWRPDLAGRFLDYLLSDAGQQVAQERSFFFAPGAATPQEVDGPASVAQSGIFHPIVIGPALLVLEDRAWRDRFLAAWSRSIVGSDDHDGEDNGQNGRAARAQ